MQNGGEEGRVCSWGQEPSALQAVVGPDCRYNGSPGRVWGRGGQGVIYTLKV